MSAVSLDDARVHRQGIAIEDRLHQRGFESPAAKKPDSERIENEVRRQRVGLLAARDRRAKAGLARRLVIGVDVHPRRATRRRLNPFFVCVGRVGIEEKWLRHQLVSELDRDDAHAIFPSSNRTEVIAWRTSSSSVAMSYDAYSNSK